MSKLPIVSGKEVIKALKKDGFVEKRTKGSHVLLKKECSDGKNIITVVPLHPELARGTLNAIIKQSGKNLEEFLKLL